jgi:hypothetical protein
MVLRVVLIRLATSFNNSETRSLLLKPVTDLSDTHHSTSKLSTKDNCSVFFVRRMNGSSKITDIFSFKNNTTLSTKHQAIDRSID